MRVLSSEMSKYIYLTYFRLELKEKKLEAHGYKLLEAMDKIWFRGVSFRDRLLLNHIVRKLKWK